MIDDRWSTPTIDWSMVDPDHRHIDGGHLPSSHRWWTPTIDTLMVDTDHRHIDGRHRPSTHRWSTPTTDTIYTVAMVNIGDTLLRSILSCLALHNYTPCISDSFKMAPTSSHCYLWKLLTKLIVTHGGWEENRYLSSTSVCYKDVSWSQYRVTKCCGANNDKWWAIVRFV